ncbi:MAG: 3-hydroxyacyl-[acyl-carrier-protein] dehydratase FabZ [Candidatus Marinimicrobia bacterium]|nr:3-hydroxyacyl-[acyl-carrier-protein] dehydratase FabZ [Candidatus Neomarinimicrobiota bacterium]
MIQSTIKDNVFIHGKGIHSGEKVTLELVPSNINTGIIFDVNNNKIRANHFNILSTNRRTSIGNASIKVHTIEHLMASLYATGITNIIVKMDSCEPPILDGSSEGYIDLINEVGIREQIYTINPIIINRKIEYNYPSKDIYIIGLPFNGFKITYIIDYPGCQGIPNEIYSIDLSGHNYKDVFYKQIAPARTFCLSSELLHLIDSKVAKGVDLNNGVAFVDKVLQDFEIEKIAKFYNLDSKDLDKKSIISNTNLRFKNEAVRHKVLDLLGDLYLLERPIKGHIIAHKSGHSANVEFVNKVAKEFKLNHSNKKYKYDINQILEILHHRYPFLLIDEITELIPHKSVTAIKNVTYNEPYFEGHFPGKPIMPGVLIMEAMAQSGGFLLLHMVDDPKKKLVVFSRINFAKFKKMVYPGDQVTFCIELLSYKMGTCKLKGQAIVDGEVVSESEFMATIQDKDF